jgi:hypothetical protein
LRRFVDAANQGIACRLADVGVVSSLHKEQQVRSKICEKVLQQTRQAVLEDISFVSSFPSEVLDEAHVQLQQRASVLQEIQQQLAPIVQEMQGLIPKDPPQNSLLDLYQWRIRIDVRRQQLQDEALCLIEENIKLWKKSGELFYNVSFGSQLEYITQIFNLISSGDFEWPKSLFELEEASYFLTRLVENKKSLCTDPRVVNLVRELKGDIDILFEAANRSQYNDILLRVMEHLRFIEDLTSEAHPEEEVEAPEVLP